MVTVRALRGSDEARWRELWGGYLTFYGAKLPEHVTQHTWETLLKDGEGHICLVAETPEDGVIGIVHYLMHASTWTMTSYCYLEDLFVEPSVRGKGAGRALIEAVYRAAEKADATRVYWNTQTHNATARVLYDQVADLSEFVQYRKQGVAR